MEMINHSVFFKLIHPAGSEKEQRFLKNAKVLASIPTVKNFNCLQEVSDQNDFAFGLSMQFENESDYEIYKQHSLHTEFVEKYWINEVENFMEVDTISI